MGFIIEISESKLEQMAEHAEKMLKHGGKLMQCIEELSEDSMGERGYSRTGFRDERDDEGGYDMGERRVSRGTGRYGRSH